MADRFPGDSNVLSVHSNRLAYDESVTTTEIIESPLKQLEAFTGCIGFVLGRAWRSTLLEGHFLQVQCIESWEGWQALYHED